MKTNFYLFAKAAVVMFVAVVLYSCGPMSKESYMENYKEFVDEVGENYKSYSSKDWSDKDEEHEKYYEEWYDRFKGELTFKDKAKLTKYAIKYNSYKGRCVWDEFVGACAEIIAPVSAEIDTLKEQIEYYIENDMQEDLDILLKEAGKLGKEVEMELQQFKLQLEQELNESETE